MRSLTILAVEIYQKLGKQYPNLTERKKATRKYILTEISQWGIKKSTTGNVLAYKPVEFNGTSDSPAFQVRLVYDENDKFYELKFGDLNASTSEEQFKWDDTDPYKMQKALFLYKVLERDVVPILKSTNIEGIKFTPYDEDDLGDERLAYFTNMFKKLNKGGEFTLGKDGTTWYITKQRLQGNVKNKTN